MPGSQSKQSSCFNTTGSSYILQLGVEGGSQADYDTGYQYDCGQPGEGELVHRTFQAGYGHADTKQGHPTEENPLHE